MTAMGDEEAAAPLNCPCSRFASGERSSELALRCCCVRGVRPGRTDLHRAAADGDVKALTAGLQQLAAERSTQQARAGAPPVTGQQPQGAEQQVHEGPFQPANGPQAQPGSSQVSCGTALPLGGSPSHTNSKSHEGGGGNPRLELPLDAAGNSPLHVAAAAAQPAAVAALLHHCAPEELERRNCFGLTPLHALAASPQPGAASEAVLHLLLHAGADPLARTLPPEDAMDASYDDSALSLVAQHARPGAGAAPLVAALVGAGLDPLEPNGTLWTCPLEYACAAGDPVVVQQCLWVAPRSSIYRKHGISAAYLLALAAAYGSTDVINVLVEPPAWLRTILAGPDDAADSSGDELQDLPDPWSVLEGPEGPDASRLPSDDGGSGGSGPSRTHRGPTAGEPMFPDWQLDYCLRVAVAQGHLDTCRFLVAAGASGSQLRCAWRTAQGWEEELREFGWQGRFPCLHAPGANLLDPPLHLALQLRHLHIAEWLIKRTGAAFPRLDCLNRTALHWAVLLGQTKLLRWLLESGQYRVRGEGEIRAVDMDDNEDWSALAYALHRGDPEAVALLCRGGANLSYSVPSARHRKTSPLTAALLVEAPEARSQIAHTLLQHGAVPDAYDLLNAIRFGRLAELRLLLAAAEAEAEGGEALEPGDAATLLFKTITWSSADCLEVLLAHGLSPCVNLKGHDGRRRTLIKTWYNLNCAMWAPHFGYSEEEGRVGWQQREDGGNEHLCASPTRAQALRIGQALVLAGADPRGVLAAIEAQAHAAPELLEVADRLCRPIWMPEQHCLWPLAFKAAAAELLRCLHGIDHRLAGMAAGMAVEGNGQLGQQQAQQAEAPHPAFPAWMRLRIVAHMGAAWEWPAAVE